MICPDCLIQGPGGGGGVVTDIKRGRGGGGGGGGGSGTDCNRGELMSRGMYNRPLLQFNQ